MRPNPLRSRWASRQVAFGGWLTIPSSVTAEVLSAHDLDYIGIDMQHGLVGYQDSIPMLQALSLGSATPMVRVPENTPANISRALDAGAMGVIVPMVNTPEQCAAAVDASFYVPKGSRSYGPTRVGAVEGPDYFDAANDAVACVPMVETSEAMDNLEEIVSVPGIECAYVGPSDLAISMGMAPGTSDPAFFSVLDRFIAICDAHDVVPAIHATPATAQDRVERGFRMVTVVADLLVLRAGTATAIAQARGEQVHLGDPLY